MWITWDLQRPPATFGAMPYICSSTATKDLASLTSQFHCFLHMIAHESVVFNIMSYLVKLSLPSYLHALLSQGISACHCWQYLSDRVLCYFLPSSPWSIIGKCLLLCIALGTLVFQSTTKIERFWGYITRIW